MATHCFKTSVVHLRLLGKPRSPRSACLSLACLTSAERAGENNAFQVGRSSSLSAPASTSNQHHDHLFVSNNALFPAVNTETVCCLLLLPQTPEMPLPLTRPPASYSLTRGNSGPLPPPPPPPSLGGTDAWLAWFRAENHQTRNLNKPRREQMGLKLEMSLDCFPLRVRLFGNETLK